ncbi:MAG: M20/M25/M40 family metallo-hydrolase [Halobacteriales archaeon]|nr:M20/M25/M40 family metallo-hydrolase [Halobacteriales archaeon]
MPLTPTAHLHEGAECIADDLLELLAVDTQNPPGATREAIDYLAAELDALGIDTEHVTIDPAKPNLLATIPGEHDTTLLLNGHLDTVPFDREHWTHDPLGERESERIYGRGTTDMKGAVASILAAARAYAETGTTPPVTLAFAFVSDEEVGGDAGLPAVLEHGLEADACVIGESTCEAGRHSLTVADRGSIWLTLEATGAGAHGSRPVLGDNAIDRLYAGIQTLREEFGGRPLECAAPVQAIVDESVEYYGPIMGEETARTLFQHPSINLGTIEGGTAINAVPESATARLDLRLAPGVNTPDVIEEIRTCAESCEGVTVADVSWSIGTYLDLDEPVVSAVRDTAESVTGERVYRRSATGGGDAKTLRNAGIPTVEFAVGTDTVHADDEYTTVDILRANAVVYTRLPEAYAAALGG